MKKLLLSLVLLTISAWVAAQDCSDILISEYVEGWNNNKAIEIYNPTPSPIDLTNQYRLIRWSNGDETSDQDMRYVLPLVGTLEPYKVFVIIQDTTFPGQDTMEAPGLKAKANYMAPANYDANTQGCRVVFWNGDDAVSLQHLISDTWTDIDIFGEIGVRPLNWQGTTDPVGAWDDTAPYADGQGEYLTKDETLKRKSNVKVGIDRDAMNLYGSDSFYALAQYDSLGNDFFDSLGFHHCDCEILGIHENQPSLRSSVFPNPVNGEKVLITSDFDMTKVVLLNLNGLKIDEILIDGRQYAYTLPTGLGKGIYLVRIYDQNNSYSSQKLIIL
jgi:hypothetical protein